MKKQLRIVIIPKNVMKLLFAQAQAKQARMKTKRVQKAKKYAKC